VEVDAGLVEQVREGLAKAWRPACNAVGVFPFSFWVGFGWLLRAYAPSQKRKWLKKLPLAYGG
jgi:hypothetical protein